MATAETLLREVPSASPWYQESDGAIFFIEASNGRPKRLLSPAARVALGFNEVCCGRGLGRVYVLAPQRSQDGQDTIAVDVINEQVELFYIPEAWSMEQRQKWPQTRRDQQLHRITATHGWIADSRVPVLPFALVFREKQQTWPELPGGGESQAITLIISPHSYIGLTREMRERCVRTQSPKGFITWRARTHDWSQFNDWKVSGLTEVLIKLHDYYCKQDPGGYPLLKFYGTIRADLLQAARAAALQESSYGSWKSVNNRFNFNKRGRG